MESIEKKMDQISLLENVFEICFLFREEKASISRFLLVGPLEYRLVTSQSVGAVPVTAAPAQSGPG